MRLMAEQRKTVSHKPRFSFKPTFMAGWVIFHCHDAETGVKNQEHWNSINCLAIDADKFPKENLVLGRFKFSTKDSSELIVQVLERQNDLSTDE